MMQMSALSHLYYSIGWRRGTAILLLRPTRCTSTNFEDAWSFKLLTEYDIKKRGLPLSREDVGLARVLGFEREADLPWFGKDFNDPYNYISDHYLGNPYIYRTTQKDPIDNIEGKLSPMVVDTTASTVTIAHIDGCTRALR